MRSLLTPGWVLSHVFAVSMVVAMIGLGFWQLDRLEARKADNDQIRAASDAPARPIEDVLDDPGVLDHTAVTVTGNYRADLSFLVANRTFDTRPGSWLATPVELADGRLAVVVRGWVPRTMVATDAVATIETPTGAVVITGRLFDSVDGGRIGEGRTSLPEISRVELDVVSRLLGVDVVGRWVQLESQDPPRNEVPVPVPPPVLDDGPHLSYAFQWFFFSVSGALTYLFILRRRLREVADGS
ncbi:MAG: SURF1 family protein [Acidimicrobiales bacterium]